MKILRPIQYFALCRILLCGHAYNTVDGSSWLSFVIALSSASCGGADGGACEVGIGTGSFGCRHYTSDWVASPQPSHHLSHFYYSQFLLLQSALRGDKKSMHARIKGQFSSVTHRMISIKYDILKQFS